VTAWDEALRAAVIAEREACARVVEAQLAAAQQRRPIILKMIAKAIRERGER
jgi:hypothetical protein